MITPHVIQALAPHLNAKRAAEVARTLQAAAIPAGITTRERVACLLAQLAHESGGFRHLVEVWGPTPAQTRYEGRRDLGNTQRGDGYRYRGRGWIQLTGRANYRLYGRLLGIDLEGRPDLAAQPATAARIAAEYWGQRGLNALADDGEFELITRRINGGLNGYQDRMRYLRLALNALPEASPPPRPRLLLVPQGGGDPVAWNGRDNPYGGVTLSPALAEQLRTVYPAGGPRREYQGLYVYHRANGDLVLERQPTAQPR